MSTEDAPRTLVLSDLHLGRPGATAQSHRFAAMLDGFDRVIVNGDIAELHHDGYRRNAELELERFRDFCARAGATLELVAGNHDPFVSATRSLTLGDGAVYITHGDALHPAIAPWSPFAAAMRATFDATVAAAGPCDDEHRLRLDAAKEAAMAEWRALGAGSYISTVANIAVRPHRALIVLAYWRRYPELVHAWATRFAPRAGTVLVGHSHRPFVRLVGGVRIVNTGAYAFPGKPLAVVLEGGAARVHRIVMEKRLFELSKKPVASWDIRHRDGTVPSAGAARQAPLPAGEPAPASAVRMNAAASASAVRSTEVR